MKTSSELSQQGVALLISVVFTSVILLVLIALVGYVIAGLRVADDWVRQVQLRTVAEAGIDYTIYKLNTDPGYNGETDVPFGAGTFTTTVTDVDASTKDLSSTATIGPRSLTIKSRATIETDDIAFNYGIQTGEGGLFMENNSGVLGNVYANSSVRGANGAFITGDVTVAGGTALTADQSQSTQTSEQVIGQISAERDAAQSFVPSVTDVINKVRLLVRKNGNPSNATVHIIADDSGSPSRPVTTALASGTLSSSLVTGTFGWVDVVFTTNPILTSGTKYWMVVDINNANTNRYFILAEHANSGYGNGIGIVGSDWSSGTPGWIDAGGDFGFETYMGGVPTFIDDVIVGPGGEDCGAAEHTGNAHANTITDSDIECDAYYQTIASTTVGGTSNPGSTDPPLVNFPISDGLIDEWELDALSGATIDPSPATEYQPLDGEQIGPAHILGDLRVLNGYTLELTGTIWVEGDIIFENNAIFNLSSAYGALSGIVIADAVGNESTKGSITLSNNVTVSGSGTPGSYVIFVSTNTGQSMGSNVAATLSNNTDQSIIYARDGMIEILNNASIREAVGFSLYLHQNATVTYETGLADATFSSGPGGSWQIQPGTWQFLPQ